MTRIWLVYWHFQSRITLWCRHKSTNVSMGLCWQMPKLIVWRLWSIYFDHHLPLKLSIGKRQKQSCTSNTILLANTPAHTLIDHQYWKVHCRIACGFSSCQSKKLWELNMPFGVNVASSVCKIRLENEAFRRHCARNPAQVLLMSISIR